MTLQLKGGIIYLWGRLGQLEGVLDVVQPDIIGIGQVESSPILALISILSSGSFLVLVGSALPWYSKPG